jgi:hypothetical protein
LAGMTGYARVFFLTWTTLQGSWSRQNLHLWSISYGKGKDMKLVENSCYPRKILLP